jgi:hypothetical protein
VRSPTSGPTVSTSGPSRSAATEDSVARVASTVRCRVVVPAAVTATGVCAAIPNSVSPLATSARWETDACRTSTPGVAATRGQSTPVRTSASRCVDPMGTPA